MHKMGLIVKGHNRSRTTISTKGRESKKHSFTLQFISCKINKIQDGLLTEKSLL